MIAAVDPIKIDLTSMSNIYKVFDSHHMLWMCIWMCPCNIIAALVDQVFESGLEFWVTFVHENMVKCND
jgi:hypothetical protein